MAKSLNRKKKFVVLYQGNIVSQHIDFYNAQTAVERHLDSGKIHNGYDIVSLSDLKIASTNIKKLEGKVETYSDSKGFYARIYINDVLADSLVFGNISEAKKSMKKSLLWNIKQLKNMGFKQSKKDYRIFTKYTYMRMNS